MPRDRGFEGATARPTLRPRGRAAGWALRTGGRPGVNLCGGRL